MREILRGIHTWFWFSEEKGFDFNGWLVLSDDGNLLIDPPPMRDEDEDQIAKLGRPAHIIVTNRDHEREIASCRDEYDAQIWMHEKDATLIEADLDHTFGHGDILPGGLEVIHIPDNKSPGESALLLRRTPGVLILGDALIGNPPGELNLLPAEKYENIAKARTGIEVLLDYDFDPVLTSDGAPILQGGKQAVQTFLDRTND